MEFFEVEFDETFVGAYIGNCGCGKGLYCNKSRPSAEIGKSVAKESLQPESGFSLSKIGKSTVKQNAR